MRRPVIGLTTYTERARFGPHDTMSAVLPLAYVRSVQAVGGRAVLICSDDADLDVLDGLDGLIITGGPDVDPARYDDEPHAMTRSQPGRDEAEALLVNAALEADLPLLGICRGMQLLTVVCGGRLHQHLPDLLGHDRHQVSADAVTGHAPGATAGHDVVLAPGSLAHAVLGARATVNSYHHQAVAEPGLLTVTGWCPDDRTVEAVEDPTRSFALGVQWHPERGDDLRTFAALVAAAKARVSASRTPVSVW